MVNLAGWQVRVGELGLGRDGEGLEGEDRGAAGIGEQVEDTRLVPLGVFDAQWLGWMTP